MSPSKKPRSPRSPKPAHVKRRHNPGAAPLTKPPPPVEPPPPAEPPPSYVATLVELGTFGWHVTEIRPDIGGVDAPMLWRVTIRRYDGYASITITEADPDAALDELARYAAVDADARTSR